jgi:hypothetical protein
MRAAREKGGLVIHAYAQPLPRRRPARLAGLVGVGLAAAALALPAGGASGARTVTLRPVADAYVTSAAPRSNFGRFRTLGVDRRPPVRTYLRFRISGLSGSVRQATLRLFVIRARGRGLRVASVRSRSWSERGITYANAPRLLTTVARAQVPASGWVDIDVTRFVRRGGVVDLGLAYAVPAGQISFASREAGARAPRLVVTTAASQDPVIAAAGNIACDPAVPEFNGGNGTSTDCRQKATSDLVNAKFAAVLTLGDAQYGCGGLAAYQQAYDPSWGRVKAITHPVPGNHDYVGSGGTDCDPSGHAAGYFGYFGAAAGQFGRSYYSFDVGAWHIIALDSQCSAVGGCGPGSLEETWLRADLAAHRTKCTLAYWHYPLFSSGIEGSKPDAASFWSVLDSAGAEVVLSAHEHDYERFAPQHLNGTAAARGIREFVVGTGGRARHAFSTVRANSRVRENGTWGVLQLTLHASSYDWRFVPAAGGTFTDSGSASCH